MAERQLHDGKRLTKSLYDGIRIGFCFPVMEVRVEHLIILINSI